MAKPVWGKKQEPSRPVRQSQMKKPRAASSRLSKVLLVLLVPCIALVVAGIFFAPTLSDFFVAAQYRMKAAPQPVQDYPAEERRRDLDVLTASLYERHRGKNAPGYEAARTTAFTAQGLIVSATGLVMGENRNGLLSFCTGTLIAEDRVLTAASCLKDMGGAPLARLYFLPNAESYTRFANGRYPVVRAITPEDASIIAGGDIALLILGQNADKENPVKARSAHRHVPESFENKVVFSGYQSPDAKEGGRVILSDCLLTGSSEYFFDSDCAVSHTMKGAPAYIYHEQWKLYLIGGVVSLSENGRTTITRLSPERSRDLLTILPHKGALADISKPLSAAWKEVSLPPLETLNILVSNACKQTVGVAYIFYNDERRWETRGFHRIAPGETHELARSINSIYRLHVRSLAPGGTSLLYGNHIHTLPGSETPYGFSEFKSTNIGDAVHRISSC